MRGARVCDALVIVILLDAGTRNVKGRRVRSNAGQTDQAQRAKARTAAKAQSDGDAGGSGEAQQRDGQIAQGGHHPCSRAPANATTIFIESPVANPVQTVFNRPVTAVVRQQASRAGFLRREAGEAINPLATELARDQIGRLPLDGEDLGHIGEIHIAVQFRAGPDAADFQTAVPFIRGGVLRGETFPDAGQRCLAGASADCP